MSILLSIRQLFTWEPRSKPLGGARHGRSGIAVARFCLAALVLLAAVRASGQSQYTIEQVTSGSANHRAPSINNPGEIMWMQDTAQGRQVFSSTRAQLTSPGGAYTEAQ